MYKLDLNLEHILRSGVDDEDRGDSRTADSDYESDSDGSDVGEGSPWARLDRRLLQRIVGFLPRQSDRRAFCLVSREWARAGESRLWAYPEFSTPKQLGRFLRVVSDRPGVYGPHIRGIRFTLASHYDRHLVSPYYCDGDTDGELPTLLEIAQGQHVLSAEPAVMRSLLNGSDLMSAALALRYGRLCAPIDRLSIYGFRLRDKHIVNDLMRWNLRELEVVGMPRKPLANLGYLLRNLRGLRSLRIESDSLLPSDAWAPLAQRLPALQRLRIWAPSISGSHLLRAMLTQQPPQTMAVFHLVGRDCDATDELVDRITAGSPLIRSLVVHGAGISATSASFALGRCARLSHLELVRDEPEPASAEPSVLLPVVASGLATLSLQNLSISDALIRSAASTVTGLRTLHISGAAHLTGSPLGDLLAASTRLVALGLHRCPVLTEELLVGLAQGPSAQLLRVLMVHQCAVQSDGVEAVLSAFPATHHFSVTGIEMVRQQFEYMYNAAAGPSDAVLAELAQDSTAIPVRRSFRPLYPSGHYLRQIAQTSADDESNDRSLAGAVLSPPGLQKTAWVDSNNPTSTFVPGLLAFANCAIGRDSPMSGRRRATTVSSEDHHLYDTAHHQSVRRLRSNSDQPTGALSPGVSYNDDEDPFHASSTVSRSLGLEPAADMEPTEAAPVVDEAYSENLDAEAKNAATEELATDTRSIEAPAVERSALEDAAADELVVSDEFAAEELAAEPTTNSIARELVVSEEPIVGAPVVEELAVEPAVEEPDVDEPVAAEVPAAEEPIVEESATDEAVVEEPVVDEPATEEVATEEPTASDELAIEESASEPAADVGARGLVVSEEPATDMPTVDESAVEPVAEESVAEEQAAEEPAVPEELAVERLATEPAAEEPAAEELAADEPVVDESVTEEVATEDPAVEEQVAEESVADEPTSDAVARELAVSEEPAVGELAAKESAAEELVVSNEPLVDETVAEELAIEEPAADETVAEVISVSEESPIDNPVDEKPLAEVVDVQEPAVEDPTAEEPTAEPPTTDEPAADRSISEESLVREAAPEESVEEPASEEPASGEPAAEEPIADEPAAEEPAAAEPVSEEPVSDETVARELAAEEPVTEELDSEEPVSGESAVEEPVAAEFVAAEPAAGELAAEETVADEPTAGEPAAEESAVEEPAADETIARELSVEEPVAEEPASEEPVAEALVVDESATEKPNSEEPAAEEPVTEEPAAKEPEAKELVAEELASDEPAAEEPVVEEQAAAEPAAEEPAAEEPAVEETVAEEPIV
ncbi:hypothetical protein GGI04_002567, partial [Coemansia thaxteri]